MFFIGLKKRIRCMLMDGNCMFWTFLFPVILCILFAMTVPESSFMNFEEIPIALIGNFNDNSSLYQSLYRANTSTGKKMFQVSLCTEVTAEDKLSSNNIVAYIKKENEYQIVANYNTEETRVVKKFMEWYEQTEGKEIMDCDMHFSMEESANPDFNKNVVYFLCLIAFSAFMSIHWGMRITHDMEGNLSCLAARILLLPVSKVYLVIENLLSVALIAFFNNACILLLIQLFHKAEVLHLAPYIMLVQMITSTAGVLTGVLIGVLGKNHVIAKQRWCETILFVSAFLSGLMFSQIRYMITEKFPVLAIINPVSIATDALFHVYFFKDFRLYIQDTCILAALTLILGVAAFVVTRRKTYASI